MMPRRGTSDAEPFEPAADVLGDMDTLVAALVQHPSQGRPKQPFKPVQSLEICKTEPRQLEGGVVLSVENCVGH